MKAFSIQLIAALVVSMISVPAFAQATNDGQAWRALAEALEGGVAIEMRLRDGRHFKATFVAAHPDAMVVQRKTRLPVPVEDIAYDSIASLARVQPGSMSAGKVAGIALGSAGAAVGTLFLILLASLD